MKLRIMNYELRMVRDFITGMSFAGLGFAGLMNLAGCSEGGSTAGVWTETESGQTASLTVLVSDESNSARSVKLALTRTIDNRTSVIDSAIADSSMKATFEKVPYNDFSIVATAYDKDNAIVSNNVVSSESFAKDHLLTDSGFVKNSIKMNLRSPALLLVRNDIAELQLGDSLCISRTLSCGIYDESAKNAGYITIGNVPSSVNYNQIEIVNAKGTQTHPVDWYVDSADTLHVTHQGVTKTNEILEFSIPKVSYLDSLGDKTLDSLLIPIKTKGQDLESFQDENWNGLPQIAFVTGGNLLNWVTLPPMGSSIQVSRGITAIDDYETVGASRVFAFNSSANAGDTAWRKGEIFEDSSFALSFWATLDSAKSDTVISAIKDDAGFEIRRCDSNPNTICTKIYNGVDTAAAVTVEFGKVKLFDGENHHYSLAIHKKHLSIVVDGNVIRSTDLKLSEDFYKVTDIKVGTDIENLLLYSFGDFIRKPEDKEWHRMNAWLQAFYEMQKDFL